MTKDARFEDAHERPLRLWAQDVEDMTVISALVQDAVLSATDMTWDRSKRQFALLLNRFRWEDQGTGSARRHPYERVRSLLVLGDVRAVSTQGIDPRQGDTVLSLLTLRFDAGDEGTGQVILTFAGDGAIACDVECLDVTLQDVTRPYLAQAANAPHHPEDP